MRLILTLLAIFSIISSSYARTGIREEPYQYTDDEGDVVVKVQAGVGLFSSIDSKLKLKDPETGEEFEEKIEDDIFKTTPYVGMELGYFFNERFSVTGSFGYMAQNEASIDNFGGGTGKITFYPFTAMAQFHIAPYGALRPYVGAGYHYSIVKSSYPNLDTSNGSGPVFQAGADWWQSKYWAVSLDAKYFMYDIDVTTNIDGRKFQSTLEASPIVLTAGVTRRF